MHPIIKVENLGKRYNIGRRQSYRTLRESVIETVAAPVRGIAGLLSRNGHEKRDPRDPHVWALRDLSFEVAPGEVLGIIGRNGSGKSTLLKILSRITEPSTGRVELYGRVGSLLEVGTGFHPELTGRENIYLSGAILGMRRAEIARKFDEMVAFAEIDQFVDTPVKHYSSGMYVRLAFAVAAHLEPEILLVDEVLAVGDAAFQKKCLGKIGEVAKLGRTVMFVSHNLATIQSLCDICLLLAAGHLTLKGRPSEVIAHYHQAETLDCHGSRSLMPGGAAEPQPGGTMESVELLGEGGTRVGSFPMGESLIVSVKFRASKPIRPALAVAMRTETGWPVFVVSNRLTMDGTDLKAMTNGLIECKIIRPPLLPGRYLIDLYFGDLADITKDSHVIRDALSVEVMPVDVLSTGRLPWAECGPVLCHSQFTVAPADGALKLNRSGRGEPGRALGS
jgi:lipopolysaccharide transport system ATP-binding protein